MIVYIENNDGVYIICEISNVGEHARKLDDVLRFTMGKDHEFTLVQKQEIIQCHERLLANGQKMSNKALIEWAYSTFHGSAQKMSISRLLTRKDVLSDMNVEYMGDSKRIKKAQCPKVEEATFTWFMTMQDNSVVLPDDIVIVAAKRFYAMIPRVPNEKELQFSHGWLDIFEKRFIIRGYTCHL
jgi:hypothetical protein